MGHSKVPPGALMSPPDADVPVRVAFLEDWATELRAELRDHELRFRALSESRPGAAKGRTSPIGGSAGEPSG